MNINSLIPKIDELRNIAKLTKAHVIAISESKVDNTVSNNEIEIEGYELIRQDRNRHGGGAACYIKNILSFNQINTFSKQIENLFFEIFLPNSHPIAVGAYY